MTPIPVARRMGARHWPPSILPTSEPACSRAFRAPLGYPYRAVAATAHPACGWPVAGPGPAGSVGIRIHIST